MQVINCSQNLILMLSLHLRLSCKWYLLSGFLTKTLCFYVHYPRNHVFDLQSDSKLLSGFPEGVMNYPKTKLRGLGPQANYTDRATAACRRS
jgi:hypothetical protein